MDSRPLPVADPLRDLVGVNIASSGSRHGREDGLAPPSRCRRRWSLSLASSRATSLCWPLICLDATILRHKESMPGSIQGVFAMCSHHMNHARFVLSVWYCKDKRNANLTCISCVLACTRSFHKPGLHLTWEGWRISLPYSLSPSSVSS